MFGLAQFHDQDGERVAVDPRDHFGRTHWRVEGQQVGAADRCAQTFGEVAKQAIPDGVTQGVVNLLIDIEIQDGARAPGASGTLQFDADHLGEELSVGETGQDIMQGQMLHPALRLDPLGDVLGNPLDLDDRTGSLPDRHRFLEDLDQ